MSNQIQEHAISLINNDDEFHKFVTKHKDEFVNAEYIDQMLDYIIKIQDAKKMIKKFDLSIIEKEFGPCVSDSIKDLHREIDICNENGNRIILDLKKILISDEKLDLISSAIASELVTINKYFRFII